MISGRPPVPQEIRPQGAAVRRYEPGTAEDWIDGLEPPPLIDGVFMLNGYLTAIIVGMEGTGPVCRDHGDRCAF